MNWTILAASFRPSVSTPLDTSKPQGLIPADGSAHVLRVEAACQQEREAAGQLLATSQLNTWPVPPRAPSLNVSSIHI